MAFDDDEIDLVSLRATAYNHRWAEMPEGVIPLTAADSDFGAPAFVRDALSTYAARGHFGYAPPFGLPEFRTAVSTFFERKRGAGVPADGVIATNGAAAAVFLAAKSVVPPGSTALAPDPCDFLIPAGIEAAGGRVVRYPVFRDRTMRLAELVARIDDATSAIFLCNPHNPLGTTLTAEEIDAVLHLARMRGITVVSDEVWSDIVYPPTRFCSALSRTQPGDRVIAIGGFSKSYAMAGLRVGFLATSNPALSRRAEDLSLQALTVDGANAAGQIAAIAALASGEEWLASYVTFLEKRRDQCLIALSSATGGRLRAPDATHVLMIPVPEVIGDAESFAALLLEKYAVAVVPGSERWFGPAAQGYVRISFATSARVLSDALDRIVRAYSWLAGA